MKGKFEAQDIANLRKHGSPMIILIYSPGCGYCTKYEPEWDNKYEEFPQYSQNHKDIKTPSIGSISFEELSDVPISVRSGSKSSNLQDIVDFVPKMVSIDERGNFHPISNIHNFDGLGERLEGMKDMSGGFLYEHSKSLGKSKTTESILKKKKKKKKKTKKTKKKRGKKRRTTRRVD